MFFNKLKEKALIDHESASRDLEEAYSEVLAASRQLNDCRDEACELIETIENYINRMARTPKSIDKKIGEIDVEITVLRKTEEYADEAYKAAVKGGVFTATGIGTGVGMVAISSNEWKELTTTFGRNNTDKVINTFSRLAKDGSIEKVRFGKLKEIRSFILKHLGKIGIGVTAASLTIGIAYVSYKNYDISNQLVESTLEISNEVAHLRKKKSEINHLNEKIGSLIRDLKQNLYRLKVLSEQYGDYGGLNKKSRGFLLAYINNTFSLAVLLNKDIK